MAVLASDFGLHALVSGLDIRPRMSSGLGFWATIDQDARDHATPPHDDSSVERDDPKTNPTNTTMGGNVDRARSHTVKTRGIGRQSSTEPERQTAMSDPENSEVPECVGDFMSASKTSSMRAARGGESGICKRNRSCTGYKYGDGSTNQDRNS